MNLSRWLILLFLVLSSSLVLAHPFSERSVKDVVQPYSKDTVVIRFDYKQSALYHSYTFEVLDSIIAILLKNKAVTLTIDGYAYKDEGSDTICYYLSLNRALFIQTYVLGRGVDSSRIISVKGHGKTKPLYKGTDKDGFKINCRAELMLNYPEGPKKVIFLDRDEDGIADSEDKCPDEFGYKANSGCPNEGIVIVPFEIQQSNLYSGTYKILDSVITVLTGNPALTISIEGHAYKDEGINSFCERLADERATIVKNYLLSRQIDISRIDTIRSVGNTRPLNAGKTPKEIAANCRAEIIFARLEKK